MMGVGRWAAIVAMTLASQVAAADVYGDLATSQAANQNGSNAIAAYQSPSYLGPIVRAFDPSFAALQALTTDLNNNPELSNATSVRITTFYSNTYEPTIKAIANQLISKKDLFVRDATYFQIRRILAYLQGNITAAGSALTTHVALGSIRDACGTTETIRRDLLPAIQAFNNI